MWQLKPLVLLMVQNKRTILAPWPQTASSKREKTNLLQTEDKAKISD